MLWNTLCNIHESVKVTLNKLGGIMHRFLRVCLPKKHIFLSYSLWCLAMQTFLVVLREVLKVLAAEVSVQIPAQWSRVAFSLLCQSLGWKIRFEGINGNKNNVPVYSG